MAFNTGKTRLDCPDCGSETVHRRVSRARVECMACGSTGFIDKRGGVRD